LLKSNFGKFIGHDHPSVMNSSKSMFSLARTKTLFFTQGEPFDDPITIDSPAEGDDFGTKSPMETEADNFAGELLVPLEMLKLHVGKSIPELSKVFHVSEQAMGVAVSKNMNALYKTK
jgi:hypothetical protein